MSCIPPADEWMKLLGTYDGRDKLVRTSYYALLLITGRMKASPFVTKLMDLARQLSAARMVGRRWNDLPMIKANLAHFRTGVVDKDKLNFLASGAVNVLYLLFHPVEHIAWLSSFELVPVDSGKWWNYTVWIWTIALVVSIMRCIHNYGKLTGARYRLLSAEGDDSNEEQDLKREQTDEIWTLVMYISDLIVAVNYLPKGILWSQTLPQWKVGAYGLVASLVGLAKLFQRLRN